MTGVQAHASTRRIAIAGMVLGAVGCLLSLSLIGCILLAGS